MGDGVGVVGDGVADVGEGLVGTDLLEGPVPPDPQAPSTTAAAATPVSTTARLRDVPCMTVLLNSKSFFRLRAIRPRCDVR